MDAVVLDRIRLLSNEQSSATTFTEAIVEQMYLANGSSIPDTVAEIWEVKAARSATLVDISEAQSSRKASQVSSNALAMAARYRDQAAGGSTGTGTRRGAVTRPIERA